MKRYIFDITFGKTWLSYDPLKNMVFLPKKKKVIKLPETPNSLFPVYNKLEKYLTPKYYTPNILTIFQGIDCNLDCSYCFTPYKETRNDIPAKIVRKAAEFISLSILI